MVSSTTQPRAVDEFAPGANEWPLDLSRRQFLEVSAATVALAGLVGCNRQPEKTIVPYVVPPDRELLDGTVYYATAMPWEGYARGVLVRSNSGRPTKIEGNPAHPDSLGATDIFMQASVLSLYDPDRSQAPRHGKSPATWEAFEREWLEIHRELDGRRGSGFAFLTEPTTSPTELGAIHRLLDRWPETKWFQHTPLPRYDQGGTQDDYDFAKADIVLAIDADFLGSHPSSLRYARAFAARRRSVEGRVHPNRLYVLEPALSLTGSMADHRLSVSPNRTRVLLSALAAIRQGQAPPQRLTANERTFVAALAEDLQRAGPNVLCVAGERVADDIREQVAGMNATFRAHGTTRHALATVRSDGDPRAAGDLKALTQALETGAIETVVIISANPAYTAPRDVPFSAALKRARRRIHLGSHHDETAALCDWHLPEAHFLESWGDLRAYDGTASIVQPLIAPLYASRGAAEFLFFLSEGLRRSDYDLVRDTWQKHAAAAEFEAAWRTWLNDGLIAGTANPRLDAGGMPAPTQGSGAVNSRDAGTPPTTDGVTLIFQPDPTIRDGRWANNGWLQELPKPGTQLVWDNPALVSPAFAARHNVRNGDVLTVRVRGSELDVPVWVAPGVSPDCIVIHLGYGRTHAGAVGNDLGFSAYRLRTSAEPWSLPVEGFARTERRVSLVCTQGHFSLEGRELARTRDVRDGTLASAGEAAATRSADAPPSLYPEIHYEGYRWGMAIDLGTCIGCKACVIACQAENNTPVVGKEQVARGREMHWLRVDHYYLGDLENPEFVHQPVPCMQCENAPCELVCPTAATVHSSEGLNDMVYNRCIGTRYCSNNCPYKVRRFNFLDYRANGDSTVYLQSNPDVTVRARGVMEKCTYCVQRINAARIAAEKENRRVRDGEVRTACQQACPTEAIVFGDLNDPNSKVRARKAEPTHYVLLGELNTRPRTTYLARTTNKHRDA